MRLHNLAQDAAGPRRRCARILRTFLPKMELWRFGHRGFALRCSLLSDRYSRSARLSAGLAKHRGETHKCGLARLHADNHRKGGGRWITASSGRRNDFIFFFFFSFFFARELVEKTCRRAGFFLIPSLRFLSSISSR